MTRYSRRVVNKPISKKYLTHSNMRSVSSWFKKDDLPKEVKFKNGSEDSDFRGTIEKITKSITDD
mgnify:CR=1 FL=1